MKTFEDAILTPTASPPDHNQISWLRLMLAACVIAPVSESVHGVMIEHLGVPYPYTPGLPIGLAFLNLVIRLAASAFFARTFVPPSWRGRTLAAAALGGLLTLMLNETMRVVFIKSAIAQSFPAALLSALPRLFFAVDAALIVYLALRLSRRSGLIIGILIIGGVSTFYASPWIQTHLDLWNARYFSDVVEHYSVPYPMFLKFRVLWGYSEPTIATFVLLSICWRFLPGSTWRRTARFTVFLLILQGRLMQFFVYSFWVEQRFPFNFLAWSQFLLETAVLALLTSLAWARWSRPDGLVLLSSRGTPP